MKRRFLINTIGLLFILVFIGVSLGFITTERKKILMNDFEVVFDEPYRFINEAEIENMVFRKFKGLKGAQIDTINTRDIENKIEELAWVKNAEVYKSYLFNDSLNNYGRIRVRIKQEKPVMRVVDNNGGYYLNTNGKRMSISNHHTINVPVFTGKINRDDLQQLLTFVNYINADPFWKALFQQVQVESNGELVLIPRIGEHRIDFGKPENIETKLRNLKLVYQEGFYGDAWNRYRSVSLKYKNQVVCTLR